MTQRSNIDANKYAHAFLANVSEHADLVALIADTCPDSSEWLDDKTEEFALFFELGVQGFQRASILNGDESATFSFASNIGFDTMMRSERGEAAVLKEVQNFLDHDAFKPRQFSSLSTAERANTVGCFMFGKEKLSGDYKARMPVLGNQQKETASEKSSPTVKHQSLFILLGILAYEQSQGKDWTSVACDIPGAYLNAPYPKGPEITPIIVRMPPKITKLFLILRPDWQEYVHVDDSLYAEALMALYGILEAGRLWYSLFSGKLISYGYTPCRFDRCLFVHRTKSAFIPLYVDDIKVIGRSDIVTATVKRIEADFAGSRLQKLNAETPIDYLSLEITNPSRGKIELRQSKLITKICDKYGIKGVQEYPCKADILDLDPDFEPASDAKFVQSAVMSAMYIARMVAPEALFACSALATTVAKPSMRSHHAAVHLLEYLRGIFDLPIIIAPTSTKIVMSCDASYATHPDAKSHSGHYIFWEGERGLISAYSGKQKLVTRSSWQAELVSAHTAGPEVIWTRNIMDEIGYTQKQPTDFEQDNQGTIESILNGAAESNRSKHVDVRFFWTKQLVDDQVIKLVKVDGSYILADLATKMDSGSAFSNRRQRVRNIK
jgi:hypothetical protein